MKASILYTVVFMILLAACQLVETVYLRHSQTGRIVQCGPYQGVGPQVGAVNVAQQRGCIKDYRVQGYLRVPRPKKETGQ